MEKLLRKISLDDIEIPNIPDIAVKVLVLLEDEYCSLKKLEELILEDQALTAYILRIANAPYYKSGKSVNTLSDAIMAIGIHNMVALVSVISLISQVNRDGQDVDLARHAIAVSTASALIARHAKVVTEDEALIAGLLHDIGKIVLFANSSAHYWAVKKRVKEERRPFTDIEHELFGFDHCDIGCMVADNWKLPKLYEYVIRHHHDGEVKDFNTCRTVEYNELLCAVVRLADKVVLDAGFGAGKPTEKNPQGLLDLLKIGETVYIEIARKIGAPQ